LKASLHIQTGVRNGKTYLKNSFFTTPLKIANITEDKSAIHLKLMLMSSSPGILDGDEYELKLELEEGSSVELQTQSYQRLFNMKKKASQKMDVYMGQGASFCYLPHPTVPHINSNFAAFNRIFVSDNCSLVWGEVLTCGRKLSGEEFVFTSYQNRTDIYLNGRLVVKENLLLEPSLVNMSAIGQFEGYSHQASLIHLNATADIKELVAEINGALAAQPGICFGVSALHVNGLIVRLLGDKGEQLFNYLQMIARMLATKEVVL
jgi:urease accessory protein